MDYHFGCRKFNIHFVPALINSSSPGQNGRHFKDDIFRCMFVNDKFYILIQILLKFVPEGSN